ncbi:regulatory protein, LuxR:Response regulator receiver [Plesiocystis pacifica SIR-1]|uniref:Regulatory protein, LuxR:Response regulator receiver n=1 Tax=Plesiocystis pacifica SIR-1 TaxID=391625 RepID=A6GCL1_9BACT|nr:response regulator transcription factor [Plesiocystis pacifica]EDM76363.1 regulatory protein, LuxR:Response regulator receiver [Plesiocystis pacifica SIR-1]
MSRSKPKLLVVEDMDVVLQTYLRTFRAAGYDPVGCETKAEALRALQDHADFDAALLDFSLPDGTALDILPVLLDKKPLTKALVVTGQDDEEVPAQLMSAGAHGYIQKPVEDSALLSGIGATVRATQAWRVALGQTGSEELPTPTDEEMQGYQTRPVEFDIRHGLMRLQFVAGLSPVQTITAWRLLWGDPDQRIAELLGCTKRTVKYHVSQVLARTGARSRSDLLRVLLEDAGVQDPWAKN